MSSKPNDERSLLQKLLAPGWKPTPATFPELYTVIIWIRFVIAVGMGFYIGTSNDNRGAVNLLYAMNLVTFVPVLYVTMYLGASLEEYGNKMIFGGAFQGIALVLLIWIYFYTLDHPEDEAAFVAVFSKGVDDAAAAAADETLKTATVDPVVEESEF